MKNIIYAMHLGDHRYRYVGLTSRGMAQRKAGHRSDMNRNVRRPVYFWMNKYGFENIVFEILQEVEVKEDLPLWEQMWIQKLALEGFNLLNLTDGGEGVNGWRPDEKWISRRSQFVKTNPIPQPKASGKKLSDSDAELIIGMRDLPAKQVAEIFNVSTTAIYKIWSNQTFKWIDRVAPDASRNKASHSSIGEDIYFQIKLALSMGKNRCWIQEEFGVSRGVLSRIESGNYEPNPWL